MFPRVLTEVTIEHSNKPQLQAECLSKSRQFLTFSQERIIWDGGGRRLLVSAGPWHRKIFPSLPQVKKQTVLPQSVSLRLVVVEITRLRHMLTDVVYLWVSCVCIRTWLIGKMCSPPPHTALHLTPILYPAHDLHSVACCSVSTAGTPGFTPKRWRRSLLALIFSF